MGRRSANRIKVKQKFLEYHHRHPLHRRYSEMDPAHLDHRVADVAVRQHRHQGQTRRWRNPQSGTMKQGMVRCWAKLICYSRLRQASSNANGWVIKRLGIWRRATQKVTLPKKYVGFNGIQDDHVKVPKANSKIQILFFFHFGLPPTLQSQRPPPQERLGEI